jgi:hypothetical protein
MLAVYGDDLLGFWAVWGEMGVICTFHVLHLSNKIRFGEGGDGALNGAGVEFGAGEGRYQGGGDDLVVSGAGLDLVVIFNI